MRRVLICFLVPVIFSCGGRGGHSPAQSLSIHNNWKQVGIYDVYGLGVDDSIRSRLESIQIYIKGDTLVANNKYHARFTVGEMKTDDFFFRNDMQTSKEFFVEFLKENGIDASNTIHFMDFISYKKHSQSDFHLSDYFEPGNCLIYEPPFVFLKYETFRICYKNMDCNIGDENFGDNNIDSPECRPVLKPASCQLPYNDTINPESVKYEIYKIDNSISGMEEYSDGESCLRYIPLPDKGDISVILVPMDHGDYPYRYYLLTIKNNKVTDKIYVEGEWWEPESDGIEKTGFTIDEDYVISVTTSYGEVVTKTRYYFDDEGYIHAI